MDRALVVLTIAVMAVVVAFVVQRRQRPTAPTQTGYNVPDHVDRADFTRPEAAWLVAVFTSATCSTCAGVWDKAQLLESEAVAVQQVELVEGRALHTKYAINGVPATVVADTSGAVRASFLGPVTATDLWATLAELRAPGTLPADGCNPAGN